MAVIDDNHVSNLLNVEGVPQSEQKAIKKLITLLSEKMIRESPSPGKLLRDAHPKQIGLVKARFEIKNNLPIHLRKGIFAAEKTYDAWVRFSNQNAPPGDDYKKDIRGMAIKLIDIDGVNASNEIGATDTQDFILISTDVFVTRNIIEFADLIEAVVAGPLRVILYFLTHWKNLFNFIQSNKRFGNILDARFWSVSPYAFGDKVVKYSVKPRSKTGTEIPTKKEASPNYLTANLVKQLAVKEFSFDFAVQFQIDKDSMPVEDLSVRWKEDKSPFIEVGTLTIPMQMFSTPQQNQLGEQLSFTPWNSIPEHIPLGGVNSARKIIYKVLSDFRH